MKDILAVVGAIALGLAVLACLGYGAYHLWTDGYNAGAREVNHEQVHPLTTERDALLVAASTFYRNEKCREAVYIKESGDLFKLDKYSFAPIHGADGPTGLEFVPAGDPRITRR